MLQEHSQDIPSGKGLKIAIVASLYNQLYVDGLLTAALDILDLAGAETPCVVRVPGSFEIPVAAAKLARKKKYDAVIALGVIFEGKTFHAEHIGAAITHGLMDIALQTGVPQIHEVLVLRSTADARARCLGLKTNRGAEAAITALSIARTLNKL